MSDPFDLLLGQQAKPPQDWPADRRTFNSLTDNVNESTLARVAVAKLGRLVVAAAAPQATPAPKPAAPKPPPEPPPMRLRYGARIVYDIAYAVVQRPDGATLQVRMALPRIWFGSFEEAVALPPRLHADSDWIDRRRRRIVALITANGCMTADALAVRVGTARRTVYRDIADMQLRGVPIAGSTVHGYTIERRS